MAIGVYNSTISRTDADPLMPLDISGQVWSGAISKSIVLPKMTRLADMSVKERELPVEQLLPTAYFVDGDTGLRQTSAMKWKKKKITAEEVCVIVPVPQNVIDDSGYPIWGQARPRCEEAIAACVDGGILLSGQPSSWPLPLLTLATNASQVVTLASFSASGDSAFYDATLGPTGLFSKVEQAGYMVNGVVADVSCMGLMRGVKDDNGRPILNTIPNQSMQYTLNGAPLSFNENESFDSGDALMIAGKFSEFVYAVRQDVAFRVAVDGVIQDGAGNIIYNLTQQRMACLLMWIRLGWQHPNPPTRRKPSEDETTRFPIAVLKTS